MQSCKNLPWSNQQLKDYNTSSQAEQVGLRQTHICIFELYASE